MRKSTASISAAVPLSSKQYSIFPFQKPALKTTSIRYSYCFLCFPEVCSSSPFSAVRLTFCCTFLFFNGCFGFLSIYIASFFLSMIFAIRFAACSYKIDASHLSRSLAKLPAKELTPSPKGNGVSLLFYKLLHQPSIAIYFLFSTALASFFGTTSLKIPSSYLALMSSSVTPSPT